MRDNVRMIYQKPLTEEDPEGYAELLEKLQTLPDGASSWLVRFSGESETVERTILDKQ